MIEFPFSFYVRVQRSQVLQPLLADIAHHPETAIGQRLEIPNQVGAPVAATNHANFDLFVHIASANSDSLVIPQRAGTLPYRRSTALRTPSGATEAAPVSFCP